MYVAVALVIADNVNVFNPVEDTDTVDVNDARDDEDALGELEMVKVIVTLVRAVSVAVLSPVVDTETVGDEDAKVDSDAAAVGESRPEEVAPTEVLGEPEIEKVIVALVKAVSVAVFKPDVDTETVGDEDPNDVTDALVDGETRLE